MSPLLTIIAAVLFVFFLKGAVSNAVSGWKSWVRKERHPSPPLLPLVPGAAGCVALSIFPLYPLVDWRWLPLVLDPGSLPALCVANAVAMREWWAEWGSINPFIKPRELGHEEPSDFRLVARLYLNGQVRLVKTNLNLVTYTDWLTESHSGTWAEADDRLVFKLGPYEIAYRRDSPTRYIWLESSQPNPFEKTDLERIEHRS